MSAPRAGGHEELSSVRIIVQLLLINNKSKTGFRQVGMHWLQEQVPG